MRYFDSFSTAIREAGHQLAIYGDWVDPGRWQGVPTEGKPDLQTRELLTWGQSVRMPAGEPDEWQEEIYLDILRHDIQPNLPWADDHFRERVGRKATNPGEAYKTWPWWQGQYDVTNAVTAQQLAGYEAYAPGYDPPLHLFTHTYQERFWPKDAGSSPRGFKGIRYRAGDLDDVVSLLVREPATRQAYLPIFFPEDTGAVHEGRIPCTLGYQFMLRDDKLHLWYFIRSCDYVRHFRDDIYLAARLLLWVLDELMERELRGDSEQLWFEVSPGYLHMMVCSLHYHRGDAHLVK